MKKLIILFLLFFTISVFAQVKGFWAPIWDIATPEDIQQIVIDAENNNFTEILAEVRYRGDALYFPNRTDNEYDNLDTRSYILSDISFDPLQYLIDLTARKNIKVIAWVTSFVITTHDLEKLSQNHIYFKNSDWVTYDKSGNPMQTNVHEGAFFDPGVPAVQDYTADVILDLATNYDIDGIHLDYIRYPGEHYGYNPVAKARYNRETEFEEDNSWRNWKEEQINRFVKRIYHEVKNIDSKIEISAAVFPNLKTTRKYYAQNWFEWLDKGYIDKVYLMAYTPDNLIFEKQISSAEIMGFSDKIVVGMRSWSDKWEYPVEKIQEKIALLSERDFAGVSFYNYKGLVDNSYLESLEKLDLPTMRPKDSFISSIFGYVRNEDLPLQNIKVSIADNSLTTDANGFFCFDDLQQEKYQIKFYEGNRLLHSQKIDLRKNPIQKVSYNVNQTSELNFYAFADRKEDGIILKWNDIPAKNLKIFRRKTSTEPFALIKIVPTDLNYWVDEDIEQNQDYEYLISDFSELIQKKVNVPNQKEIAISINEKRDNVQFQFSLKNPARLNWRLVSEQGQILIKKQSWYKSGSTIENWNKITEKGEPISSGKYTLYCFSDTLNQEYKKEIFIENKVR